MTRNINGALDNIDMTYDELIEIVDTIRDEVLGDVDNIIQYIGCGLERLTNDQLREAILNLSLKAFSFSEIKEKSAFKAEIAETLRKEAYAKAYTSAEGTASARDSSATFSVSEEIIAEEIHDLLSNLFKTKLDEIHRCVDSLKVILTTRLSEAKLSAE